MRKFKGGEMKRKINILIFLLLSFVMLSTFCYAADITGTTIRYEDTAWKISGYSWDISGAISVAGDTDSDVMVGIADCEEYTLFIMAGTSANFSVAIKVSADNSNWSTTNTYTLAADTNYSYSWTSPTPFMKLTYTRTAGTINDTKVYCRTAK